MRILAVLAVGLLWIGCASAQDADEGQAIFSNLCATCHGTDARGGGPMGEILDIVPPDLTGLAAANEGAFPVARVARQIDGRDPLLAHGGPMPLFGRYFEGDDVAIKAETGQPIMTSRGIADLIAWLETIQE